MEKEVSIRDEPYHIEKNSGIIGRSAEREVFVTPTREGGEKHGHRKSRNC